MSSRNQKSGCGCVGRVFLMLVVWNVLWGSASLAFIGLRQIFLSPKPQPFTGEIRGHYVYDAVVLADPGYAQNPVTSLAESEYFNEGRFRHHFSIIAISVTPASFYIRGGKGMYVEYAMGKDVVYVGNNTFVFRKLKRLGANIPIPIGWSMNLGHCVTKAVFSESALDIETDMLEAGFPITPIPLILFFNNRYMMSLPVIPDGEGFH